MCVFALNFMFHCCALFFAFSCLSDEGVPSWRGVDLSLVATLYDLFLVFGFVFIIFCVFLTEQAYYVCRDEARE